MQVPPVEKPDRPKILGPKPTIASKPKHLPPVRKVSRDDLHKANISKQNETNNETKKIQQQQPLKTTTTATTTATTIHQIEKKTDKYSLSKTEETFQSYIMPGISGTSKLETQQQMRKCQNEKCDKFRIEEKQKGPASPSTVCCSILSSATTDCCGIIPTYKKELNSKMNKMESVDSNSSDSGGFKDFIQLDLISNNKDTTNVVQRESYQMHQRNISHPEFQEKKIESQQQQKTHQRYGSQPEYVLQQQQSQHEETVRKHYVPNAQALAQYLPLAEKQMMKQSSTINYNVPDDSSSTASSNEIRQHITKFNVAQFGSSIDKTDINTTNKRPQNQQQSTQRTNNLISHGQFQQSTKKLEELFSQRLEREKCGWKGQTCLVDGETSQDADQKMLVQKQMQQKLQADLQQTVKQIQAIQSIELRLPQNRKWSEVS